MAFGASFLNSYGAVQIDQDYFNLSYKTKGTVSSITASAFYIMAGFEAPADSNMIYFVVDYPSTNTAIVAVTPPTGRALGCLHLINETNTSNPPPSGYKRAIFYCQGTTAASISYYVFDNVAPTLGDTGYGLQVKNGAGNLVFHSSSPVFRAKSLVTLSQGNVGATLALPSGRTHAFVFCNPSKGYYSTSASTRLKVVGFELTSLTLVTLIGMNNWNPDVAGAVYNQPSLGFVVDVSFLP